MTNPNFTAIAVVLDRSGSMYSIEKDAEGALNAFVEEQKLVPGHATLTLTKFDDTVEVSPTLPLQEVEKIKLEPRGSTALYDAIGRTIKALGQELRTKPESERPGKVIFVVVTDGGENASKEYRSVSVINDLIAHQRDKYNWDFVFLAANQDAIATGGRLGFAHGSTMTFAANAVGVGNTVNSLSTYATNYRGSGKAAFSDADRKAAVDS